MCSKMKIDDEIELPDMVYESAGVKREFWNLLDKMKETYPSKATDISEFQKIILRTTEDSINQNKEFELNLITILISLFASISGGLIVALVQYNMQQGTTTISDLEKYLNISLCAFLILAGYWVLRWLSFSKKNKAIRIMGDHSVLSKHWKKP
jgi:hypothetical protein